MDRTAYNQTLALLKKYKPNLTTFFHRFFEYVSGKTSMTEENIKALGRCTIASEYLYIDYPVLLGKAIKGGDLDSFSRILYELTTIKPSYGEVFLTAYRNFSYPVSDIEETLSDFIRTALNHSVKAENLLDFCLEGNHKERTAFLLSQFTLVGAKEPGALMELFSATQETLKQLPLPVLKKWFGRGTDLLTSNRREEGMLHLKMLSRESRRFLGFHYVTLEDMKRVLPIYVGSIAGKSVSVANLEISSFNIRKPYTDGKTIFLPPKIDCFNNDKSNEMVYSVLAALQAAYLRYGTFGFNPDSIDFREPLQRQYGAMIPNIMENVRTYYHRYAKTIRERPTGEIEVIYPSERTLLILDTDHERFFYLFPTPGFIRELFFLIETVRVEHLLEERYSGLKQDFRIYNRYLWKLRPSISIDASEPHFSRFTSSIEALIQWALSGTWKNDDKWKPGTLKNRNIGEGGFISEGGDEMLADIVAALIREAEKIRTAAATVYDTARTSYRLYNLFFEHFPLVAYCNRGDVREHFAGFDKAGVYPEIIREMSPELLHIREKKPHPVNTEEPEERDIDLTSLSRSEKKAKEMREALIQGALKIYRHAEYDWKNGSYLRKHCTVYESYCPNSGTRSDNRNGTPEAGRTRPDNPNGLFEGEKDNDITRRHAGRDYKSILDTYNLQYKKIKKKFLAMQPEEIEITRKWLEGNEMHIGDAVDYATELLRGASPDDKIYMRKQENVRDIVAAIVVDASSSTDEKVGNSRIIDIETAALSLLASALSLIGDAFGIFTFFSMGRNNVFYNIVKNFNEPWNEDIQGRIGSIEANAGNRDGCAIRHTSAKLHERPEKTKLLILLSDGIPADYGYGSNENGKTSGADTTEYAIEDTRRAILEARMNGIIPFCITIDSSAKRYIPHLYGDYNYVVLPDVTLLPEKLSSLYLRLTK